MTRHLPLAFIAALLTFAAVTVARPARARATTKAKAKTAEGATP